MTREEAIELKAAVGRLMYSNNKDVRDYNALIDFIESALHPVSREQVEKVWKGEWEYVPETLNTYSQFKCTVCGWWTLDPSINGAYHYCPNCGAAQTDEAVQMVMERLEKMKDDDTDN